MPGPQRWLAVAAALFLLAGWMNAAPAQEQRATVAVFPVENLSGGSVPAGEVRQFLVDRLTAAGIGVLDAGAFDAFLTRHRIRYTAGIDGPAAESLRQETGVNGVVFASVELSSAAVPPKIALIARFVSIDGAPVVAWADAAGMSGDDAPGLFGLGLVNDYQVLFTRALDRLADSLLAYLETRKVRPAAEGASRFRPKRFYRGLAIEPGRLYSVAVMPFFNLSERRNAGEILALHFVRHLSASPQFRVVDTGAVRRQLLDARIIMDGGLSITDAETVAALVEADLVLGGRVLRYEDYEGPAGQTRVEFSTVLVDRKSRRLVWSSDSDNEGSDGVGFFGRGGSKTAHAMATEMVRFTTRMIAGRER